MPGPPQFGRASITNVRNVRSPHWRGCWASLIAALCHQLRFASAPTHSPQRRRARAESTNSPSNHHDTSHNGTQNPAARSPAPRDQTRGLQRARGWAAERAASSTTATRRCSVRSGQRTWLRRLLGPRGDQPPVVLHMRFRPENRSAKATEARSGRQQRRAQERRQVVIAAVVVPLDEVLNNRPHTGERRRRCFH
jgi:hypothetical protein